MRHVKQPVPLVWQICLLFAICGLFASRHVLPAACAALIILCLDRRFHTPARLCTALFLFIVAFFWASSELYLAQKEAMNIPSWVSAKKQTIRALITDVQGQPGNRLKIRLEHTAPANNPEAELPGVCIWTWDEPLFTPIAGQYIKLDRPVRPARGFANNSAESYQTYLLANRIYWRIWSKGANGAPEIAGKTETLPLLRHRLREKFLDILWPQTERTRPMPKSKAILLALLFGDRQYISLDTAARFADAALAHSLALSGQHLAIAGLLAATLAFGIGRLHAGIFLLVPRPHLVALLAVPFAVIYLWLGNAPPSLIRACAMLFIGVLWLWQRRKFSGADLLFAALLCILLWNPLLCFDIGLQLSALCVGIIIMFWPVTNNVTHTPSQGATTKIGLFLLKIFLVSLAIQITLLPFNIQQFQTAGLLFPLNIIWLPLLGVIALPAAALALMFCAIPQIGAPLAQALLHIAAWPCEIMLAILDILAELGAFAQKAWLMPGWSTLFAFPLLMGAASFALAPGINTQKQIRLCMCLGLALLSLAPLQRLWPKNEIRIEALDTGQGQAIAVTLPNRIRLLVDGGGSAGERFDPGRRIVGPLLAANNAPVIEGVFNSHPDLDHVRGLFYIIDAFQIKNLFHNGRQANSNLEKDWKKRRDKAGAIELSAGDRVYLGGKKAPIYLEALHPPSNSPSGKDTGANGASLVLRLVRNDEGLALFPGDADKAAQKRILEAGNDIRSRIVFAPHHGSDKNLLAAFYKACDPEAVIACCGYRNRYGYPGRQLRTKLRDMQISLLDTGTHGKVVAIIRNDNSLSLETALEHARE